MMAMTSAVIEATKINVSVMWICIFLQRGNRLSVFVNAAFGMAAPAASYAAAAIALRILAWWRNAVSASALDRVAPAGWYAI